ncbi:nucleotidyltransferase family protein [Aggregatimonas sangjinii]|uniref:Nucleotidyltransferase family protein n=1 Tax=Aggregatimonas sangjinii TaxID=2583587 RepID=A0A5B7ST68_9FLAO|nr:nucleotidyltransferase family protein [Aggregatimonas sangjinii]QCX00050.1 nucleotidyltransferase family protein [Aggregatimonas sangjinii]
MNTDRCAVLILAAGSSSRMGRPKQLLPWGSQTLLQNAVNNANASRCDEAVVVLGANADIIRNSLQPGTVSVVNTDWENGMGSSIARGMQFLSKKETPFEVVLIMLGDQPFIDADYLNNVRSTFQGSQKNIVATDYGNRAGVPALFGSKYFEQLSELNSEYGAKELLAENMADIHLLKAGVKTADIDTEADYSRLNHLNT